MTRFAVFILVVFAVVLTAEAELTLNGLFTDNMVLQRNQKVPVWGNADPGAEVTVEFGKQRRTAKAKPDGSWMVHLKSMKASPTPQELSVSSSIANQESKMSWLAMSGWLAGSRSVFLVGAKLVDVGDDDFPGAA